MPKLDHNHNNWCCLNTTTTCWKASWPVFSAKLSAYTAGIQNLY